MHIVQMAIRLGVLPSQLENEDLYWFHRLSEYFAAEVEADKKK
jgi:hypothetical protein